VKLSTVQHQLARIRTAAEDHDDERAHSLEDSLHADVLRAIAAGGMSAENAAAIAADALTSHAISFARWYA